jgi:hypothetical protein
MAGKEDQRPKRTSRASDRFGSNLPVPGRGREGLQYDAQGHPTSSWVVWRPLVRDSRERPREPDQQPAIAF